ncbi:MAG TPA: acetoacetate decarboxylase family protein [Acidimicrobiales bacterium]|nr:acetoacetate decarboxylase family protein [Acidimicrobiales bacterium]
MTVLVQGRELTFPIVIRKARSWAAQYRVDKTRAQALVPAPLQATGLVSLAFVQYEEGDLDAYNEFGLTLMVKDLKTGKLASYIHRLPVSEPFTCEAGRTIWGYPKWVTDVAIEGATCRVEDQVELTVGRGWFPMPLPAVPTYSACDGVLRRTEWDVDTKGLRARLGGARLTLGTGELAHELRSLGLPKRALMTTTIPSFKVSFGPAETVATD